MNIFTNNFEMDAGTKDYLEKRLKSIEKFVDINDENTNLSIEIGKATDHHQKGNFFRTEINLNFGGNYYRAEAEEVSIPSSIDISVEELLMQLGKSKDKKVSMLRRSGARVKDFLRRFDPRGKF
jgi:ribosomal subunit interface protein